jgi:hypothetical protein
VGHIQVWTTSSERSSGLLVADDRSVLADSLVGLAWSLWGELGVSTWTRAHQDWMVELEPLIVFTATVGEHDARLRREAVDWCVQNSAFLSISQLRHVVKGWPPAGLVGFADFAATVSRITGRSWPQQDLGEPYSFGTSGKSRLRSIEQPSLLQLRLRAMFGVGSRAEILRCLLTAPGEDLSTAQIAAGVAYTRRQITADLEMLVRSGLVVRRTDAGPSRYSLADVAAVERLTGRAPSVVPTWTQLFIVLQAVSASLEAVSSGGFQQPEVELAARMRAIEGPMQALRLRVPQPQAGDHGSELADWAQHFAAALAAGDASALSTGDRPLD